ncbi:transposable element Tcb1 transposase [Trichonephila clavipes]|nr:transposable element Tcb1 transposase [Trichonephila clavipes]
MIVRSATNKPMTSAQNIANELQSCNVSVSAQTVRNVLHSAGLKARTPRQKPYISEVNRKSLEFAMKYKNKPMDFWKKSFSDESKFEIFTPLSIRKIWRKSKTALEPKNVLPTLKHGGGNVMVWRCIAHNGAATRRLLATDHIILNHGQFTWTTPELAPPLLTTTPHQREDVSALDRFNVHRCPTRRVFGGTDLELMPCLPVLGEEEEGAVLVT